MLPETVEKAGAVSAAGVSVGLVLHYLGKVVLKIAERWRPSDVVEDSIAESLRKTIDHQSEQIHDLERDNTALRVDIKALRVEARKSAIDAYIKQAMIENFLVDFPHHAPWWRERLANRVDG